MQIFHNEKINQLNVVDERFYTEDYVNFYPSVTHVLETYPKGEGFYNYLKTVGENDKYFLKIAGREGSEVHNAVETYFTKGAVEWNTHPEAHNYNINVWQMICKFFEFWELGIFKMVFCEKRILALGLGGTVDLLLQGPDGKYYVADIKTSNNVYETAFMQIATYSKMLKHIANEKGKKFKVSGAFIIHLKASTRTYKADFEKREIQGHGWQCKFIDETQIQEYGELFKAVKKIWDYQNPNPKPKNLTLPTRFNNPDFNTKPF